MKIEVPANAEVYIHDFKLVSESGSWPLGPKIHSASINPNAGGLVLVPIFISGATALPLLALLLFLLLAYNTNGPISPELSDFWKTPFLFRITPGTIIIVMMMVLLIGAVAAWLIKTKGFNDQTQFKLTIRFANGVSVVFYSRNVAFLSQILLKTCETLTPVHMHIKIDLKNCTVERLDVETKTVAHNSNLQVHPDSEPLINFIREHGINIYCWPRTCYKCGRETPIYSYYLDCDLHRSDILLQVQIRLGDIPTLDRYLMNKYPCIHSGKNGSPSNFCCHCKSVQGRIYTIDDCELSLELNMKSMDEYCIEVYQCIDQSLVYDIEELLAVPKAPK